MLGYNYQSTRGYEKLKKYFTELITEFIEKLKLALKNPNYFNESTLENAIERIIDYLQGKLKE